MSLILLSTDGCHLCELAKKQLNELRLPFNVIDIVTDDALVEAYGASIPVLLIQGKEQALFWPFEKEQVIEYVKFYGIS